MTAATLYEAVALGLAAIRHDQWTAQIAEGLNVVEVGAVTVSVVHEVRMKDFLSWLDRKDGSPREMSDRQRIKAILAMRAQ